MHTIITLRPLSSYSRVSTKKAGRVTESTHFSDDSRFPLYETVYPYFVGVKFHLKNQHRRLFSALSPLMAGSVNSDKISASKDGMGLIYTSIEDPSHRILQVSKVSGNGSIGWQDTADGFCTSGFAAPGLEDANGDLIEDSKNLETIMSNKGKMDVLEIDERTNAHEQIEELEDNNRMEKKRNRRRGKARKNRDTLNYHSCEKAEKKGLQYSRKEMEDLRFVGLEEQKAKWVQVYCGFGALVGKEYDGLAKLDRGHQKHNNVLSFDFDPRSLFQNSTSLSDNLDITEDASDEMACSLVEGDCSQDDESDEDYSSMQRPAFLVTGEPDFDSGPPEDGLEYLRRVRWEASKIPKVVTVSKVNKTKEQSFYVPQIPDIAKCPENLLPIKEWEESFLADFSELRQAFAKLDVEDPHVKSSSTSLPSVHGDNALVQILEENRDTPEATFVDSSCTDDNDSCPSESSFTLNTSDPKPHSTPSPDPTLSSLLRMSPAARVSMLKRRISSMQNLSTLSRNDSLWLFALCAAVDSPLDGDATAAIRSLLRKCASLRAEKTQMDDQVVVLNILVAISGQYFGQLEK